MSAKPLAGRTAIITGGARGLGFAIANRLAADGAMAAIVDIDGAEQAAATIRAQGLKAVGILADVTQEAAVAAMAAKVEADNGCVDILVNNAAISSSLRPTPFEALTVEEWRRVFDVNVLGLFLCARAVSAGMRARKAGRIINLASGAAFKGLPNFLHYVGSKGAILSMTRALAKEFGPDNITVNAVAPGFILKDVEEPEANPYRASALANRALSRDAYPADVVGTVAFLASDDAGFISGQIIAVDGGSIYH